MKKTLLTCTISSLALAALTGCGTTPTPNADPVESAPGHDGAAAHVSASPANTANPNNCHRDDGESQTPNDWTVTRVIDGDTVKAKPNNLDCSFGEEETVRILGINAPEIAHNDSEKDQCGGGASTSWAESVLPAGAQIQLITDSKADDRDKYGRMLRYVQIEEPAHLNQDYSELAVSSGFAAPWKPKNAAEPTRMPIYNTDWEQAKTNKAGNLAICSEDSLTKHD